MCVVAATPTILVQQLDENNDPVEGANGPVFLQDRDAVAQIIMTTLRLLRGEWWEDLSIGFPLRQNLLGHTGAPSGQQELLSALETTILTAAPPYVLQILSFSLIGDTGTRATAFLAEVSTVFGTVTVTNSPGISAQVSS